MMGYLTVFEYSQHYQECAWRANHLLPGKEGETNMRNLIAISQAKTEKIKQG